MPGVYSTPTARVPSNTIRVVSARVCTSRLGRRHHGVQVRAGRAQAPTAADVAVEAGEALLAVPVDVVGELVAGLLHRREERSEQRVGRGPALEHERPAAAAELVGAGEARLHALEVREAVRVRPRLHARIGGPALVVERVAALEDHPVDAARAAEHLAARVVDPPAVHVRLGLRLVLPVVEPPADRERQRRRHVDEHVPLVVGPAGLEHEHARRGILAQPVGEHAAGGTAADDDEVVLRHTLRCGSVVTTATPARPSGWRRPTSAPRPRSSCRRRSCTW